MGITAWIRRLRQGRRSAKRELSTRRRREELFPSLFVRQLEERRVLNGTPLVFDAGLPDGEDDTFHVVREGDNIEVSVNEDVVYSGLLDDVSSITFNGSTDSDTLVVDLSGGDPFPESGIFFDGGDGGGDLLILEGSPLVGGIDTLTHRFDGIGEGFIAVDFGAPAVISGIG